MNRLSVNDIIFLHSKLINSTGGLDGTRDIGLIESAVNQVDQTFDGEELYASIEEKAARLGYALISNHGFIDGNKRIGIFAMLVFLEINNIKIKFTQQELIYLGIGAASGKLKYSDVLHFIKIHKE